MEQGTRIPATVEPVVPLLTYQQADVDLYGDSADEQERDRQGKA